MSAALTAAEVVQDPSLLPHRIDIENRRLIFRRASEEALRAAAFIDGRTDIWTGSPVALPFSALPQLEARPSRYIFHMSFCGSTLLARLLDCPGGVLSLKEPNCLVDLADWRTALAAASSPSSDFDPVLRFAAAMLGRPWQSGEAIVIKPSSWANNLIADLMRPDATRAVFVTIGREEFLEAVLRGGRDRLAFTARLAAHLSWFVEGGNGLLQLAIDSTDDPVGKAARLGLVAHDLQLRLFEDRAHGAHVVDFAEISADPAQAAAGAAEALGIELDQSDVEANCARWGRENAKADASYSSEQRRSENEEVRAQFAKLIDTGLDWAAGALGPPHLKPPA